MTHPVVYPFLQKLQNTLAKHEMLQPGDRVLVACSGGGDSMALLDALATLRESMEIEIYVCHVNHQLRGTESHEDERFVVEQVEPLNLPLTVRRFEADEAERVKAGNLEEEARTLRYAKLVNTAHELNCTQVATAHTLSDQAETVLHRILRACGITGLGGIAPVREIDGMPVIRPLLAHSREEVREYLQNRARPFREDSMNEDAAFTRVRIRKQLIPHLLEYNPSLFESLDHLAELARDEEAHWQQVIRHLVHEVGTASPQAPGDRMAFERRNTAEQRRLLGHYLRQRNLDPSFEHIESMRRLLLREAPQGEIHLSDRFHFLRRYDQFFFDVPEEEQVALKPKAIKAPGATPLPDYNLIIRATLRPASVMQFPTNYSNSAEFDADKVQHPIQIRTRRDGDVIRPFGMEGHKKIKKLMQEHRLANERRAHWPLICFGDEVAWAIGLAQSELFRIDESTQNILRLDIEPIDEQTSG
mgnify:CR=1 FL=1